MWGGGRRQRSEQHAWVQAQWVGKGQVGPPDGSGEGWQVAEEARSRVCHTRSLRPEKALFG